MPGYAALVLKQPAFRGHSKELSLLAESGEMYSRRTRRRSPEILEEWTDSGAAVESVLAQSTIQSLLAGITPGAYKNQLHMFADKQESRFVGNNGNAVAANAVQKAMESLGLKAWQQPLSRGKQLTRLYGGRTDMGGNVIGKLDGTDLSHETIILGAHLDSVNWEDTFDIAPGVDDNGSGIALLLMAAKALAGAAPPRRTILFVAFNAEEEGCIGSQQFAKLAAKGKYGDVKSVIIADEVAWSGLAGKNRGAIFETVGAVKGTDALLDTLAGIDKSLGNKGLNKFMVNKHGFSSDHIPFLNEGIPTVLLIELDNMHHADLYGHSARDTFEFVDFSFGATMTRIALQAVAMLASPKS